MTTFNVSVPGRGLDLWLYSFASHQARPLLETASVEDQARFSPDGHWLAYSSNETGQNEVYICALTEAGVRGKWVISTGGGIEPQWRGDSKELFYATRAALARIMAVDISEKNGAIVPGVPHPLFESRMAGSGRNRWTVTADGKRFLVNVPPAEKPATTLNVVLNWPALIAK